MFWRKAFTLLEVNLAIMVMAGGILSVVVFFSLGYRENSQSREDVASAAYADAVLSPLVMALSQQDLTWSKFNSIQSKPSEKGWAEYIDHQTGRVKSGAESLAQSAYSEVMGKANGSSKGLPASLPTDAAGGLTAGLVVLHQDGEGIVRLAFRAAKKESTLMSAPLYYTEVRFQGKQEDKNN